MLRRHILAAGAAAALGGCAVRSAPGEGGVPRLAADAVVRKVAFGSCTDQTKPQPVWDTVRAGRPDLVVFGGDNVYASTQPWSLAQLEAAYALQAAVPSFARLRSEVPHLAIWDDHDFGLNDGGSGFPHKAASKEAFLRFWQVPQGDPRRSREGIYHAQVYGPPGRRLQVLLLDTRWFKSPWRPTDQRNAPGKERYLPDPDPAKTLLGEAQWQWLEQQLRVPAEVRLLVSGIQVVADGHGWERWGLFPHELQRLAGLVAQTRAHGLVCLSGDRHIGALYREARGMPYPLHELTSSGITHPWREAAEAGPNRLGDLFGEVHYGQVAIDWDAGAVELAIHDLAGAVRRSQRIPFQQLRVPA